LDHFGLEVESMSLALERIRRFDPGLSYVQRPAVRPNAAFSAHDPDMIIFDLAERNSGKAQDIFAENSGALPQRYINHICLRVRDPERSAEFYSTVFELTLLNDRSGGAYHLSDGRVRMVLMPWTMDNFVGHDPQPPALEHFGFKVESVEAIRKEMIELIGVNPQMVTKPLGIGAEGEARLSVFKQCPIGEFHLTDLEGVYVDVTEH
ncbi:MAG TPA: VOC family protein, partial [Beijerinckiaceae bacterium]